MIISIFGFLYSTLIFTNASGEVTEKRIEKSKKYVLWGDILSEYLGVYLLVFSLPLVINVITPDLYLRGVTLIASVGGLVIYHFLHFSMIERHLKKDYDKFAIVLIAFAILIFFSQIYKFFFVELSVLFIVYIFFITYLAAKSKM